jgi:hypothetical protein
MIAEGRVGEALEVAVDDVKDELVKHLLRV